MLPKVAAARRIKGNAQFEGAIQSISYSTNQNMQSNFAKISFIVSLLIACTQAVTIKAENRQPLHRSVLAQQAGDADDTTGTDAVDTTGADADDTTVAGAGATTGAGADATTGADAATVAGFIPFTAVSAADSLTTSGGKYDDNDCGCDDHCDACKKNIDFPFVCKCPHLQDCAVNGSSGAGSIGSTGTVGVDVTTVGSVGVPNILASHATATNTCGLEVSNEKSCGEKKKYKCFDIEGQINVCERIRTYGCEGERECSDGRYTKTSTSFTHTDS